MTTEELLQEGRLDEAITAQITIVKSKPTDAEARYLLFALLCFAGEWERAAKQLDALGIQDEQLQAGSLIYRNLLASEFDRRAVLQGKDRPLLPDPVPDHVERRLSALEALCGVDTDAATAAIDEAVELQPELRGRINGSPFVALRDQDDLIGSVLEVFAGGRYLWLPFERIVRLEVDEPQHLLDLLWLPAKLEDRDGSEANVHLPVLYGGSGSSDDDQIRLGRLTDWVETGDLYRGTGQRIFAHAAEDEEVSETAVAALRRLEIDA